MNFDQVHSNECFAELHNSSYQIDSRYTTADMSSPPLKPPMILPGDRRTPVSAAIQAAGHLKFKLPVHISGTNLCLGECSHETAWQFHSGGPATVALRWRRLLGPHVHPLWQKHRQGEIFTIIESLRHDNLVLDRRVNSRSRYTSKIQDSLLVEHTIVAFHMQSSIITPCMTVLRHSVLRQTALIHKRFTGSDIDYRKRQWHISVCAVRWGCRHCQF